MPRLTPRQLTPLCISRWTDKLSVVHPYPRKVFTHRRGDIWIHATVWTNLKNIVLSERWQTQKVVYCMVPFYMSRVDWVQP